MAPDRGLGTLYAERIGISANANCEKARDRADVDGESPIAVHSRVCWLYPRMYCLSFLFNHLKGKSSMKHFINTRTFVLRPLSIGSTGLTLRRTLPAHITCSYIALSLLNQYIHSEPLHKQQPSLNHVQHALSRRERAHGSSLDSHCNLSASHTPDQD